MAGLNQPSFKRTKGRAIYYPYIQLNKLRRAYITLDIDNPGSKFAHKEIGLPPPTIILVNPANGHSHVFYELHNPVTFSGESRKKPQQYFMAVQKGLTDKFKADPHFSSHMVKNPFHNTQRGGEWEYVFNYVTYDLETLASHVDLRNYRDSFPTKVNRKPFRGPVLKGTRNVTVFYELRQYSYAEVKNHENYETFSHALRVYALSLNKMHCKPSLPESEVELIIKRVCEWKWDIRDDFKKRRSKKKGVMGFEPIPENLDVPERKAEIKSKAEIKRRQREGAKFTHSTRKRKTEKAIAKAIEQLKTEGKRVSKSAAARLAGISRETISRRYKYLFDESKSVTYGGPSDKKPTASPSDK
jgi:hypothetical protein